MAEGGPQAIANFVIYIALALSEIASRLQRLASSLHALSQQSLRAAQAAAAK